MNNKPSGKVATFVPRELAERIRERARRFYKIKSNQEGKNEKV